MTSDVQKGPEGLTADCKMELEFNCHNKKWNNIQTDRRNYATIANNFYNKLRYNNIVDFARSGWVDCQWSSFIFREIRWQVTIICEGNCVW